MVTFTDKKIQKYQQTSGPSVTRPWYQMNTTSSSSEEDNHRIRKWHLQKYHPNFQKVIQNSKDINSLCSDAENEDNECVWYESIILLSSQSTQTIQNRQALLQYNKMQKKRTVDVLEHELSNCMPFCSKC